MKKLTTLLAVATLALAVGACKKKRETEQKDDTTATRPADEPKPAPKPDDKPKTEAKLDTGVPAECTAYKELIDKLATCEKLPQKARDALKATYDNAAKAWATPPTEEPAKKTLADSCKTNTDALRSAAAAPCGW